ncbi:MAG TPA: alkaline phosphatase family protein [Dehalococcoidia bacterium]
MADRRVVIIGLDCAAPELVFDRFAADLPNIGRLRAQGAWGPLQSVVPAITVPAWACAMTSRDPGQLGIYGFRNRKDHSYDGLAMANANLVREDAVWDVLGREGRHVILVGVPPSYPPRPVNGVRVGCFLTPSTQSEYTHPPELKAEIQATVGDYKIDVEDFRSEDKQRILDGAHDMAQKRFNLFRHFLKTKPWDFAMMVEIGVDRVHHGFWKYFDETHPKYEAGNPFEQAVLEYYVAMDAEVGRTLAELDDDTTVLIMSDHGAKRMIGGVCVNEWLQREGYLSLKSKPETPTPFSVDLVDWPRTTAWSDGGYYARVFLNVRGREPDGVIDASEYDRVRDEISRKLEALVDHEGRPMGTRVFKPEQIYRATNNVAPDLIVYFGDLNWRSVGSLGMDDIYTFENDTGPDDANHAEHGIFIMRGSGVTPGRRDGLQITDIGPTVLSRLGAQIPPEMIGTPIV